MPGPGQGGMDRRTCREHVKRRVLTGEERSSGLVRAEIGSAWNHVSVSSVLPVKVKV